MAEKKHRHQHMNPKFKDTTMINKAIILSVLLSFSALSFAADAPEKPKTKQVCKEVNKNGKVVKECKTIKIHKKLEGTKVPPEKKK